MPLAPKDPSPVKPAGINNTMLRKTIVSNRIFFSIPFVCLVLSIVLAGIDVWFFILFIMCAIASSLFVYIKINTNQEKFTINFRESVVQDKIKALDSSINYEPKSYFNLKEIMYSGLLEMLPNKYEGENYFEQKNPHYTTEISWAYAARVTIRNSYGARGIPRQSTSSECLMYGLFYKFTLPKRFKTNVIIRQDKKGGVFNIFENNPDFLYRNFFAMEIPNKDFEKEFEVYTQDINEAKNLVNNELMQIMLQIQKHYRTKVQLSLIDNVVYMTVDSQKKYFKPGFMLSESSASVQKISRDIQEILFIPEQIHGTLLKIIENNN